MALLPLEEAYGSSRITLPKITLPKITLPKNERGPLVARRAECARIFCLMWHRKIKRHRHALSIEQSTNLGDRSTSGHRSAQGSRGGVVEDVGCFANGFRCEAALRHDPDVVEQGRDSWWLGGRTREGSIGSSRISRMVPYTKEAESLADHGNPFHFGPFGR